MTDRITSSESRILQLCDEVLFYLWDPIGINDNVGARDEYGTYAGQMYSRIRVGDREGAIDYLMWVEREMMGLPARRGEAVRITDYLLAGAEHIRRLSAS